MCPQPPDETTVSSDDVSPARRSTLLFPVRSLVSAAVFGAIVFAVAQIVSTRVGNRAEVVMILDQDRIIWPYHDSVRQEAIGQLENSDAATALLVELAGSDATVEGEMLSGQSHFSFTVDSSDVNRSVAAADALATWLSEASQAERVDQLTDSLEALVGRERALQDSLDVQLEQIDEASSADWSPDEVLAAARYEQVARQLAETERERAQMQATIDSLRPQIKPAGPAQPLGSPLSPVTTALAGAVAALGALAFLRSDPEPRQPDEQSDAP